MERETVDNLTILLVNGGSHAYGTATPTSDHDVRGVMIPPIDCILGMNRVEQYEQKGDPDVVIYELRKYIALAADCNPNILEVVYADTSDILKITPIGQKLRNARKMFLSRKAKHTYSGYAMSQLKRIESHRRWLLNPPSAPPTRAEFGLPERTMISKDQLAAAESIMRKQVEAWENTLPTFGVDVLEPAAQIEMREKIISTLTEIKAATDDERMLAAGRILGLDSNFLDVLDRERKYITKRREWDAYGQWRSGRNEARAELEKKYLYDAKHGMHLVRLMRQCEEILSTGEVCVRRPDAQELLAIRNGAWSYDRLIGWAKEQDARMNELYSSSPLPHSPDRKAINELCMELMDDALMKQRTRPDNVDLDA